MSGFYSSTDFHHEKFSAHGVYEVHMENGVFICTLTGPMNIEGILALGRVRRVCVEESKVGNTVAAIVEFRKSMMMSPEALELYSTQFSQHYEELHSTFKVAYVVAKEVEGRSIMLPFFSEIFSKNKVIWQAFEEFGRAKIWINS